MAKLKMGKKGGPRNAAKKFEKVINQPVDKRIADFLIEEGKRERAEKDPKKKIAGSRVPNEDLDI